MTKPSTGRMAAAHQALESSRLLRDRGDRGGACNRAYYAMFYAAHAALHAAGIIKPGVTVKTHAGLNALLGKELVRAGKLPAALGSSFSKMLNTRLLADYDDAGAIEATDVEWAVGEAQKFVAAIEVALPRLGDGGI